MFDRSFDTHLATVGVESALHADNLVVVGHRHVGDDGAFIEGDVTFISNVVQYAAFARNGLRADVDENCVLDVAFANVAVDEQRVGLGPTPNLAGQSNLHASQSILQTVKAHFGIQLLSCPSPITHRAGVSLRFCDAKEKAHGNRLHVLPDNFAVVVVEIFYLPRSSSHQRLVTACFVCFVFVFSLCLGVHRHCMR